MKSFLAKSLALFCCLGLVQCASLVRPKKVVINPLAERVAAMEIDLKDQTKEIARLNTLVRQLSERKTDPETDSEARTLGSLMKKPPVVKIRPEPKKEDSTQISPLMEEVETVADSSQELMHQYYRGLNYYQEKKFEEAVEAFRSFVNESPNHVYADRAQFLIADSHFQNKDYAMVIVATNLLETKYPYSVKLAEATYRRGIAFIHLNQMAQAKTTLNQLIKNFPTDPAADLARKKWAELSKEPSTTVQ